MVALVNVIGGVIVGDNLYHATAEAGVVVARCASRRSTSYQEISAVAMAAIVALILNLDATEAHSHAIFVNVIVMTTGFLAAINIATRALDNRTLRSNEDIPPTEASEIRRVAPMQVKIAILAYTLGTTALSKVGSTLFVNYFGASLPPSLAAMLEAGMEVEIDLAAAAYLAHWTNAHNEQVITL